jgi:hypothetical protein
MKTSILFLGLVLLLGCNSQKQNVANITFQIDMSEIIDEIEDHQTIGIVGSGPFEWQVHQLEETSSNIFSATFEWEIENADTIEYTYIHSHDIFDEGNIGVAAYRKLILAPGTKVLPIVKWGELELNTGRANPSPMLRVEQSDTEAERKALSDPFTGITSDGKIQSNLFSIKSTGISTGEIKSAVEEFLNSLAPEQKINCTFPIDAPEWRRWSNIDFYKRKGIGIPDLTKDQKKLAFQILKNSLSPKGFQKTQDIMKMEGYLARLSGEFDLLGPDLYWFTFMGEPSDKEPWGWQLDGHHLVINYLILGDQIVMTPTFMGSEPNYIVDGENAGVRTFESEEKLGLKLYTSLTSTQKNEATLFNKKDYNYLQSGAYNDNAVIPYLGLMANSLDEVQMAIMKELIQAYIGSMKEGHAEIRMEEIMNHIDETYFSWVGDTDAKSPFYYRIHSPVVLIEFDHQKPIFLKGRKPTKKHVHTIVRTPNGNDYGKDLLKQHLETHHH